MRRYVKFICLLLVSSILFSSCGNSEIQNDSTTDIAESAESTASPSQPPAVFDEEAFIEALNARLAEDSIPLECYSYRPSYANAIYCFRNTETGKTPDDPLECRLYLNINLQYNTLRDLSLDFYTDDPEFTDYFVPLTAILTMLCDETVTMEQALAIHEMPPDITDSTATATFHSTDTLSLALNTDTSGWQSYSILLPNEVSENLFDYNYHEPTVKFGEFMITEVTAGELINEYMRCLGSPLIISAFSSDRVFTGETVEDFGKTYQVARSSQLYQFSNAFLEPLDSERFGMHIIHGPKLVGFDIGETKHERVYQIHIFYGAVPAELQQYQYFYYSSSGEKMTVDCFTALVIAASLVMDDQLTLDEAVSIHTMAPTKTTGTKQTTYFYAHNVTHVLEKDSETGFVNYTATAKTN